MSTEPTSIHDAVDAWLRRLSSTESPPPSVVAFNLGLFENEDGFSAYLAGAERYDEDDGDWACDEAFTPRERYLTLPARRGEMKWQQVLELVTDAVRGFLASVSGADSFLARASAVTVGFDDGDLVRVK